MPVSRVRLSIAPSSSPVIMRCRLALSALGLSALLAGCGQSNTAPAGPASGMPPAEVGVVTVTSAI